MLSQFVQTFPPASAGNVPGTVVLRGGSGTVVGDVRVEGYIEYPTIGVMDELLTINDLQQIVSSGLSVNGVATLTYVGENFAPLEDPEFSGVPKAPTAPAGTNTTQLATCQFCHTEIANVINSAPGALDTLDELAAALGDDSNFAATVTTSLGNRLRVDAVQGLSSGQKQQARENAGLGATDMATFDKVIANNNITEVSITVDGKGGVVTAGVKKPYRPGLPAGTILGWYLVADQLGSVTFDIKKASAGGFPTFASIVAAAPPVLSSAQKNQSTTLTGWTTSLTEGDLFQFEITGTPASATWVTLVVRIKRG